MLHVHTSINPLNPRRRNIVAEKICEDPRGDDVSSPWYMRHLEKTWAYLTIQQLLDKADSLDKTEERNQTKEKALNLALQYSFVTPLTSLVVVKPNETESAVDTTQVKPGPENSLLLQGVFIPMDTSNREAGTTKSR
ncbi:hyaluronan metabolic process [Homalodisca vitripennis]|nr:hyaluronan metabolic process [Homalodisca vitripennis]